MGPLDHTSLFNVVGQKEKPKDGGKKKPKKKVPKKTGIIIPKKPPPPTVDMKLKAGRDVGDVVRHCARAWSQFPESFKDKYGKGYCRPLRPWNPDSYSYLWSWRRLKNQDKDPDEWDRYDEHWRKRQGREEVGTKGQGQDGDDMDTDVDGLSGLVGMMTISTAKDPSLQMK